MMRWAAAALVAVASLARVTEAQPAEPTGRVIFARGGKLLETDPKGRTESELALLPAAGAPAASVRALRTDARGRVLLADLGGRWWWMPLDGKTRELSRLPCGDGPAQLATDGASVLCRPPPDSTDPGSVIFNLGLGAMTPVPVPTPGARLVGQGTDRRLVWADPQGVWSAPPWALAKRQEVAPDPPIRSFSPSPDGTRALGVYVDQVYESARKAQQGEVLTSFALDGRGARRKAIRAGVPIEWSHDSKWVLVQDRSSACIMSAIGGQYKCWKGYTGVSLSPDGKFALVLGERHRAEEPDNKSKNKGKKDKRTTDKTSKGSRDKDRPSGDDDAMEPSGEAENRAEVVGAGDDVEVPPPSGALSLYRVKLDGPFAEAPVKVMTVVDGAATWVPAPVPAP